MDGSPLSPFPHHSWFGFSVDLPSASTAVIEHRSVSHELVLGTAGAVDVRWTCRGRETSYQHAVDQVAFFARHNAAHVHVIRSAATPSNSYVLQIPDHQLNACVESDGGGVPSEWCDFLPREDAVLRECTIRLRGKLGHGVSLEIGSEIVARKLVLRLVELLGGKKPDWHDDHSGFTPPVMKQIVEYLDTLLHHQFCLQELASLVGCSPSHFARKFRHTEGLSLGRFINRRRLAAAMRTLQNDSTPLAQIALDLGFSSQSHFTRLFSDLTGMTPAKFQRQCRHACAPLGGGLEAHCRAVMNLISRSKAHGSGN
jgi:AraC-like DNA-binding protein